MPPCQFGSLFPYVLLSGLASLQDANGSLLANRWSFPHPALERLPGYLLTTLPGWAGDHRAALVFQIGRLTARLPFVREMGPFSGTAGA
jgi:hypothetical protein